MQESGVDLEFDILNDIIEDLHPKHGFYKIQSRTLDDVIRYVYDLCLARQSGLVCLHEISFLFRVPCFLPLMGVVFDLVHVEVA